LSSLAGLIPLGEMAGARCPAAQYWRRAKAGGPERRERNGAMSEPSFDPDAQVTRYEVRRFRRILWMSIAGQFALSAGLITYLVMSSSSASPPARAAKPVVLTWDKVRTGDCLQGELLEFGNGAGLPDTVTSVSCRRSHLGEVVFTGRAWSAGQAYPGDDAISDQGDHRCARELTAYEGGNPRGKAFTYQSVEPYGDSWKTGDRTLTCIAYKPSNLGGAPVSYSIKSGH
jgi:hypothetical protein